MLQVRSTGAFKYLVIDALLTPPSFTQLRVGVVEGELKALRLECRHVLLPLTCLPLEPLGVSDGIEGGLGIHKRRVQRDELLCPRRRVQGRRIGFENQSRSHFGHIFEGLGPFELVLQRRQRPKLLVLWQILLILDRVARGLSAFGLGPVQLELLHSVTADGCVLWRQKTPVLLLLGQIWRTLDMVALVLSGPVPRVIPLKAISGHVIRRPSPGHFRRTSPGKIR